MLLIVQIIIGVALITVILLQRQGAGLGGAFGGGGGEFFHTKRGTEKYLFISTIVLSIIFFLLALINISGIL